MKESNALEQIKALKEAYVNETEEVSRRKLFFEIYDLERAMQHPWVEKKRSDRK